jgi:hypothetical protein
MKNLDRSPHEHSEKLSAPICDAVRQCRWHDENVSRVTQKNLPQIQNVALPTLIARNAQTMIAQRRRNTAFINPIATVG